MTAQIKGLVQRSEIGLVAPDSRQAFEPPIIGGTSHWEGTRLWGSLWQLGHATCVVKWRGIQQFHMRNGYADIAYNIGVCVHGFVFILRGLHVRSGANGTNYSNGHSYAVCQLRGPGDPFPVEMRDATEWAYLLIRVFGAAGREQDCHRDWVATQCPSDEGCAHTKGFVLTLPAPTPPVPGPTPTPPPVGTAPPWPGRYLRLQLVFMRGLDVAGWQGQMRKRGWTLDLDGIYGNESDSVCRAFQAEKGLHVDGVVGPATWSAAWTAPIT